VEEKIEEEVLWKRLRSDQAERIITQMGAVLEQCKKNGKSYKEFKDLVDELRPKLSKEDFSECLNFSEEYFKLSLDVIHFSVTIRVKAEIVLVARDPVIQERAFIKFLDQYAPAAAHLPNNNDNKEPSASNGISNGDVERRCSECKRRGEELCKRLLENENYKATFGEKLLKFASWTGVIVGGLGIAIGVAYYTYPLLPSAAVVKRSAILAVAALAGARPKPVAADEERPSWRPSTADRWTPWVGPIDPATADEVGPTAPATADKMGPTVPATADKRNRVYANLALLGGIMAFSAGVAGVKNSSPTVEDLVQKIRIIDNRLDRTRLQLAKLGASCLGMRGIEEIKPHGSLREIINRCKELENFAMDC